MTPVPLPPIPATCPPDRLKELKRAQTEATTALWAEGRLEAELRRKREKSRIAVARYENLVAEVNGQGTLDLT